MMPVLSGPELLEIMAEDERLAKLPVVVVSAVADRGTAPGVAKFLRKPVASDVCAPSSPSTVLPHTESGGADC